MNTSTINGQKVIVTGATGGLGRNLCAYLLAHGYQVLACGRNQEIGQTLGTSFQAFDLSQDKALQNAISRTGFADASVIFHCAALSSPWGKVQDFRQANVTATEQVMQALAYFSIPKLVHVSTSSVYFDFTDRRDVCEDFLPSQFVNAYAATKYQAEQVVIQQANKQPQLQAVILRPRGIFGEYDTALLPRLQRVADKGFLPLVCRQKGADKACGQAVVDVTYVGNVVHAMHLAAQTPLAQHDTPVINITNDEPMTIADIYTHVIEHLGLSARLKPLPYSLLTTLATGMEATAKMGLTAEPLLTRYGVGMIAFDQTLNIDKAKNCLNYQPLFTITEGLQRYAKHTSYQ